MEEEIRSTVHITFTEDASYSRVTEKERVLSCATILLEYQNALSAISQHDEGYTVTLSTDIGTAHAFLQAVKRRGRGLSARLTIE